MIYLAGPHTEFAWKLELSRALQARGGSAIVCFDPIAAFGQVKDANVCEDDCRKINDINRMAIRASDLVIANLSFGVTLGTVRDIEHATVSNILVLAVCGDGFSKFESMVATVDLRLMPTLEDAAEQAIQELL